MAERPLFALHFGNRQRSKPVTTFRRFMVASNYSTVCFDSIDIPTEDQTGLGVGTDAAGLCPGPAPAGTGRYLGGHLLCNPPRPTHLQNLISPRQVLLFFAVCFASSNKCAGRASL